MKTTINDNFWNPLIDLARDVILPYQWSVLNDAEKSHCVENLRDAAKVLNGTRAEVGVFKGFVFQDSDFYKWLEAAAFSLASVPDPKLASVCDEAIGCIAAAQHDDGYINSYFTVARPESRFANLREAHELYCAGHLIEAAVAYHNATGKRTVLDIAVKFADLLCETFGAGDGKIPGYPGHEEIELALIKLEKATGNAKYAELARYFVEQRGKEPHYYEEERKKDDHFIVWGPRQGDAIDHSYNQAHEQPKNQREAVGHAVRAVYLYSAMADLARRFGDEELKAACAAIFDDISLRKMYITGAIGSTRHGEAFTGAYDLPPATAYAETCAAVGFVMFAKRMYALTGEAKYIDALEKALYNAVISGVSLSGTEFFYVNPLEVNDADESNPDYSHVRRSRQPWFDCACCPPNLARTVLNLSEYAYDYSDGVMTLNLFIAGEIEIDGAKITIKTDYPYDGKVSVTAEGTNVPKIRRRVPSENRYEYLQFDGGKAEFYADVTPKLVYANPSARHMIGKAALVAGPVVYCAETFDNGYGPSLFIIPADGKFERKSANGLPDGTPSYTVAAKRLVTDDSAPLYSSEKPRYADCPLTFVPYRLWGNRGKGEMSVFIGVRGLALNILSKRL